MKILESCKIVFLKAKKCIAFVSVCNAAFQIFGGTTKGGPNIQIEPGLNTFENTLKYYDYSHFK